MISWVRNFMKPNVPEPPIDVSMGSTESTLKSGIVNKSSEKDKKLVAVLNRDPSIDSAIEVEEQQTTAKKQKTIIGRLTEIGVMVEIFVAKDANNAMQQYRVPHLSFKDLPEIGTYYRCTGTVSDLDESKFDMNTKVEKLSPDSRPILCERHDINEMHFPKGCTLPVFSERKISERMRRLLSNTNQQGGIRKVSGIKKPDETQTNGVVGHKPKSSTLIKSKKVYLEVTIGERSKDGFLFCHADDFPPILDTGGFLNGLERYQAQPMLRNCPAPVKIGVWCEPRKYPYEGIEWKVIGVQKKFASKKQFQSGSGSMTKCAGDYTPIVKPQMFEGLIYSQTAADYLVYSSKPKCTALLSKRRSKDNIIGYWIKFETINEGALTLVSKFEVIPSKVQTLPADKYVMLRCKITIPRALESSELPWCDTLSLNIQDPMNLLRQMHCGRTMISTIGCAAHSSNLDPEWQLLHIDDF